MESRHQTL
jgi:hypothetical protein